jgi:hypothetical protein
MNSLLPESSSRSFVIGMIVAAFSAGGTFMLWQESHPSARTLALALGCEHEITDQDSCPAAKDAREARRATIELKNDIAVLRSSLARGFGRALVPPLGPGVRDEAGKAALRMFQSELSQGIAPETAMAHVLESDYR